MQPAPFLIELGLRTDSVPSFSEYPFCLDAVRTLDTIPLHPAVTFFVGENGSGKSTLLEAIAIAWGFNPEGGTRNFRFRTRGSHSPLHQHLRLSRSARKPSDGFFLRAESFFNLATEIEKLDEGPGGPPIIESYGGISLHEQSHGESFLALLTHRFSGDSLFVLDEPEAALSPSRQLSMLSRMHDLVSAGSQFIIATHSPIIMAYPHSTIYALDENGVRSVEYEETDHYQTTKSFLNARERMLNVLLEP